MKTNPDLIADRLREEADGISPHFSPSLHERIMRQIRSQPVPTLRSMSISRSQLGWTLSAAAVLAIVGGVVLKQMRRPIQPAAPRHFALHQSSPIPQFAVQFPSLSESASSELLGARYAYLDRDAVTLARYLTDQINISPTPLKHQ